MYLPHILLASEELSIRSNKGRSPGLYSLFNHVVSHKKPSHQIIRQWYIFMIPVLTVAETASVFHRIPDYAIVQHPYSARIIHL